MKIERAESLSNAQIACCDFSFEISEELAPPYDNPFEHAFPVAPYRKTYKFAAEEFEGLSETENRLLLVARQNNSLGGYLLASKSWNRYVQIDDFAVERSWRRSGIGRLLMDGAVAWAQQQHLPGLRLETQANNVAACRFYFHYGFRLGGFDTQLYTALGKPRPETALFWYYFLQ